MGRPKSPIKAWIVEQRKAHGWKSDELAQRLDVSESTVRGWEAASGGQPKAENIDALERVFGVTFSGRDEPPGDQAAIVAAVREQTEAIREQTAMIERNVASINRNANATEQLVIALAARLDQADVERQAGLDDLVAALAVAFGPRATGEGAPVGAPADGLRRDTDR